MARRSTSLLSLLVVSLLGICLVLPGCKQQEDLMQRLDPVSRERLSAVPAGETVLLSLKGTKPPADLPPLGEGGRVLGRSGTSLLLEVPRDTLPALGGVKGITGTTIWGGGSTVARLDPSLRAQVLQSLDEGAADQPLNMIATFKGSPSDLRERLEAMGAAPRTVAGPIVTMDASPAVILNMLTMPDLVSLNRPRLLNPLLKKQ